MKLIVFIINIILFPVRIIYRILAKPIYVIGWYTSQGIKKAKMVARTKEKRIRIRNKFKKLESKNREEHKRNKSEIIR